MGGGVVENNKVVVDIFNVYSLLGWMIQFDNKRICQMGVWAATKFICNAVISNYYNFRFTPKTTKQIGVRWHWGGSISIQPHQTKSICEASREPNWISMANIEPGGPKKRHPLNLQKILGENFGVVLKFIIWMAKIEFWG